MGMTELLYLASMEAAYERTFRARVLAVPPGGVVLDRTLFYPVGGGQPADHGVIRRSDGSNFRVVDVVRSGASVLHRLDRPRAPAAAWQAGEEVVGEVDWARRFTHMRSHTAQHLLSARAFALTGVRTRKAVLGHGGGRIEIESAWPAEPSWSSLGEDLAGWVARSLPVNLHFIPRVEYDRDPSPRSALVPLAPNVDPVRLVEIAPADRCPCGGTHVRNTSEIGEVDLAPPRRLADGAEELSFTLRSVATPTPSA
jgi:misacylated tRNA(Ala) deacylase